MWIRGRSLRPGRNDNDEEEFQLDLTKDHSENIRDILTNICKKQGVTSERRRLSYLNAFVKLLTKCEHDYSKLGFNAEEILYCLRPALLHDTTQVRSGGLRALRYMLRNRHEAVICYKLQYPLLIARSLDLITGNDNERVQAMRVVRRLMCLDVATFPVCLARALVAIASGTEDKLINLTLAALAELCVLNPDLLISVGGVTTLLRSLSNVRSARMAEALVGSLLYLQNKPGTRLRAGLSLDCLAAPYTDLQPGDKTKENQATDRLKWPHVTLLSTLRSWPGVLHFCHPLKDGLRSIVATLYLNQLDVRKAVLDLLYELLCLAQPEWSDEMGVALEAVDPSRTQDAFKLSEGFLAAEGKAVLPHLSKCRVNLSELHLSLLLYCFLEVGLLDAIVEVIIAEDTFLSVRATILLGELLHLIHLLLPPECCNLTPSLPNLLSYAVRGRRHTTLLGYPDTPVTPQSSLQSNVESFMGVDATNKKDLISRMGIRSGHSSVRTVSESSNTDKTGKQDVSETTDKRTANEEESPYNSERRDSSNPNRRHSKSQGDRTSHLLKDVREVLADMTNASDLKSPFKVSTRSRHRSTSSLPASLPSVSLPSPSPEAPVCVRAQQRALAAVMALSRLHRLLRLRPAPASIHLDHVLASVTGTQALDGVELARAKGKTLSRNKLNQALTKECDEAIKECQVLSIKDCFLWNWDIIKSLLKSRPECLRKCEDSQHRQFLRRLVQFVLPSSRQMSRVDFSSDRRTVNTYTLTAMELLDVLLCCEESEGEKLLVELLTGVKTQFEAITTSKSAHDCMFSPQAVTNSLCQDYFLLVGHLSRTQRGCDLLDRLGIIQIFLVLATTSKHDCYVKLIISSLDYSSDERIRNIMASTLVSTQVSSRLYATKFLRVLLRTPLGKREGYAQWVIELLANQLSDESRAVALCAVAALDEACDCKEYLEALIDLRPSLLHLGDKGLLLLIRFLSTEKGFSYMSEANFVSTQLAKWVRFNYKYVCIVEGEVADGLTLVERNEDGRYSSRLSHSKRVPSDVYVPPHLYGQLAQHPQGLSVLLADDNVNKLVQVVLDGQCSTDSEILDLKAALWAVGHLSSSPAGAVWARDRSVTKALVRLACDSTVYSIRSTAFHAIALTATNAEGADTLRSLGWHTVRHNRNQQWPVVPPLSLLEDVLLQFQEERYGTRDSSESSATNTDTATRNGLFILGEDPSEEVDGNDSFCGFTARERAARERKSATLPPTGSSHAASHGYHHNRSFSESKADSGSDITDFRGQDNSRLYSESSTSGASSCGDSSQPRTYISEKLMQTLSPIPSTDSLSTIRSHRRMSVASSQAAHMTPQDMVGYAALRNLQRSRRPTMFTHPHFPLHFPPTAPHSLSPLSPIELFAFQDWKQMSPLVRPKHPDHHHIEPQFEVTGVHCPLPSDSQSTRALHYESSRACIAQPPDDPIDEESCGPCYQGICLPQNLLDMFPAEEISVKAQDPQQDNNSTTGMDVSSCDSETDTEGERGAKPCTPHRRRHERATCLLCAVSRVARTHQPRWRKVSASSQHRTRTETESSYGGEGESPVVLQWQTKVGLEGITSVDSSSTDITSVAQRSLGETFKSRSMVRKEILRLAEQLSNPILYKTCKQALLQLKQVYSDIFNDVCVYSDVCAVMASASLRVYARRFLQELFLDAPFSELYEEPLNMLTTQNNTDSEEGPCGDKISIGSETASNEDYPVETSNWKTTGPKMNGFDTEPRSGQGYELEVILESDARSESSDVCRLSGEGGRGSITPLEPKAFPEGKMSSERGVSDEHSQAVDGPECHLTVSRSSQQLRKEFFNAALPSDSPSSEKDVGNTSSVEVKNVRHKESFALMVADSITKSQGMLEPKLPSQPDDAAELVKVEKTGKESGVVHLNHNENHKCMKDQESHQTVNFKDKKEEDGVSQSILLDNKHADEEKRRASCVSKEEPVVDSSKSQSNSNKTSGIKIEKSNSKSANESLSVREPSPTLSNINKSPQLTKKGKKGNSTKVLSIASKTEVPPSKTSIENFPTQNCNQRRENISPKVNNEMKVESFVGKSNTTKTQSKTSDIVTDASSSSKVPSKNVKLKTGDSPSSSGKPPSGVGRQRKKATSKTPNRDNLDPAKKKAESGSR